MIFCLQVHALECEVIGYFYSNTGPNRGVCGVGTTSKTDYEMFVRMLTVHGDQNDSYEIT